MIGDVVVSYQDTATIRNLKFSPDSNYVLTGMWYGAEAKVIEVSTGNLLTTFIAHNDAANGIGAVDFSPDSVYAATGDDDSSATGGFANSVIYVWEALTGTIITTFSEHPGVVTGISYVSNDKIISSDSSGNIFIWNPTTGAIIETINYGDTILEMYTYEDKTIIGGNGQVDLINTELGGALINSYSEGTGSYVAAAIHNKVAYAGNSTGPTAYVRDYEGNLLTTVTSNSDIKSLSFSPDGRYIMTGDDNGYVKIFDAETGTEIISIIESTEIHNTVQDNRFSPDGKFFATGGDTKILKVYEATDISGKIYFKVDGVIYNNNGVTLKLNAGMLMENDSKIKAISFVNNTGLAQDVTVSATSDAGVYTTFSKAEPFTNSSSLSYTGVADGSETEFFVKVESTGGIGNKKVTLNLT